MAILGEIGHFQACMGHFPIKIPIKNEHGWYPIVYGSMKFCFGLWPYHTYPHGLPKIRREIPEEKVSACAAGARTGLPDAERWRPTPTCASSNIHYTQ